MTKAKHVVLIVMFFTGTVLAQSTTASKASSPKSQQAGAEQPTTVSSALDRQLRGMEGEFVSGADAMPEDKYDFAPTSGEFSGVRKFGEQVRHMAATQYMVSAAILGEKPSAQLGEGDQFPCRPRPGAHGLRVHPLSSLGVTLNLEILAQLFITDGPALVQKRLDFLEDERVPLDGGRVVRLLVPDPFPDLRGLFGTGQATHLRKIFDGPVEPVEDRQPARPAPSSRLVRSLFLGWHVPNHINSSVRSALEKTNVPNSAERALLSAVQRVQPTAERGIEQLDGVQGGPCLPGAPERRRDLQQAAGIRARVDVRFGVEHVPRLALAELARRVGLHEVVDARAPAAELLLRGLDELELRDRA